MKAAFTVVIPARMSSTRLPGKMLADAQLVVMTEKDAVKCAAFADTRQWFLRVSAVLPPEFESFLLDRLHGFQAA